MSSDKYQDIADAFCNDEKLKHEVIYIKEIDDFAWYDSSRGCFDILDREQFHERLYRWILSSVNKNITTAMIKDVSKQIGWLIHKRQELVESPYIAMNGGLYNMETFEVEEASCSKFVYHYINMDVQDILNPKKPTKFFTYLDDVLVDDNNKPDKELQTVVQEMFGFYLLPDMEPHVAFFLVGGGKNGKSVMLDLFTAIIGNEFITSMSIETLTTNNFAVSDLIGKKMNMCAEEESKYMRPDKWKAFVSGDPVDSDRKYATRISFRNRAKFLFATNEPPGFTGLNTGLIRRYMEIPFKREIPKDMRIPNLGKKLAQSELSGIVAWAIEGAKRLIENNYTFSNSFAIAEKARQFEERLSSAVGFIREEFEEDTSSFISNADLYQQYKVWCDVTGHRPLKRNNFLKDIRQILEVDSDVKRVDGQAVRGRYLKRKNESSSLVDSLEF